MNELLCDETPDLIELALDGELTAAEGARLEAHLAACRSCGREMALALRIRRELRALQPAAARVVPFPQSSGRHSSARLALAAALLGLTVGGAIVLEQIRVRPAPPARPQAASSAEVAQATAEARYALAYVGKVGRHAGLDLRDGLLRRRLSSAASTDEP
jgi:anti-sigma factor RsiW